MGIGGGLYAVAGRTGVLLMLVSVELSSRRFGEEVLVPTHTWSTILGSRSESSRLPRTIGPIATVAFSAVLTKIQQCTQLRVALQYLHESACCRCGTASTT
jgi:hypothetical protein